MSRIYNRIQNAGPKGISIKQIARHERISVSRTQYYFRLMHKAQRGGDARISKLGTKFYYVRLHPHQARVKVKPKTVEHTPSVWTLPHQGDTEAELRAYVNYASSNQPARSIQIDIVTVVPYAWSEILAGSQRIKDLVEARLGSKLASMLKFGVSGITPTSADHFLYKRQGGGWVEF